MQNAVCHGHCRHCRFLILHLVALRSGFQSFSCAAGCDDRQCARGRVCVRYAEISREACSPDFSRQQGSVCGSPSVRGSLVQLDEPPGVGFLYLVRLVLRYFGIKSRNLHWHEDKKSWEKLLHHARKPRSLLQVFRLFAYTEHML